MHIEKYRNGRYFAVYDDAGSLVCVTLYKKGAMEVVRRLQGVNGHRPEPPACLPPAPSPRTLRHWRRALAVAILLTGYDGHNTQYLKDLSHYLTQHP